MRGRALLALGAGVALASCGGGSSGSGSSGALPPVKRQPGSWTSKIEIARLEGADVKPGQREQMQQMFDMFGKVSICITPEAAAREDVARNFEQSAGNSNCTFDKRTVSGETIEFAAMCDRDGRKVRMTAKGKNGATAQDVTLTVEPLDPAGKPEGVMEMHVTSQRAGECKPTDITPPAAPAGTGGNVTG
ncbi:MAG: DUF3617 family protein [Novosphingobium sp.]|nr:DUF3617 family protein [Novosphingobium sp.]